MKRTAIILAGGMGTRLREVVKELPKPMADVNGKPFLNYLFDYLHYYKTEQIILSTGHLAEKISEHFGSSYKGVEILYSHEESPMGTGGGIRLAMEKSTNETILVLNGDSFFDVDLNSFYEKHSDANAKASIALRKVKDAGRYGSVEIDSKNNLRHFNEKKEGQSQGLINAGVYLLDRNYFFENTPKAAAFSIEKDFFGKVNGSPEVFAFEYAGYFIDIGIPDDYLKAQHEFKKFKY
ncbi:MAG TPA: nucleotidyltransferase family protein [Bacteroidia bacterium]|nr:nucleotidyltransferase family protein [Bacteroidia bacterium]